jgi:hypothetical protein
VAWKGRPGEWTVRPEDGQGAEQGKAHGERARGPAATKGARAGGPRSGGGAQQGGVRHLHTAAPVVASSWQVHEGPQPW